MPTYCVVVGVYSSPVKENMAISRSGEESSYVKYKALFYHINFNFTALRIFSKMRWWWGGDTMMLWFDDLQKQHGWLRNQRCGVWSDAIDETRLREMRNLWCWITIHYASCIDVGHRWWSYHIIARSSSYVISWHPITLSKKHGACTLHKNYTHSCNFFILPFSLMQAREKSYNS